MARLAQTEGAIHNNNIVVLKIMLNENRNNSTIRTTVYNNYKSLRTLPYYKNYDVIVTIITAKTI